MVTCNTCHQMASLASTLYKIQFRTPLGELTTLPQTPYSAGEGETEKASRGYSLPRSLTFSSKSCACTYTHTYISSYRTLLRWEQEAIVFSYTSPWGPFFRPFAMADLCDGGPLRWRTGTLLSDPMSNCLNSTVCK